MQPVRRLIANFLRTGEAAVVEELAPDVMLRHADLVEWSHLHKAAISFFSLFLVVSFVLQIRDLGQGSFGSVELYDRDGGCPVVVKKLLSLTDESEEEAVNAYLAFLRECWMMKLLEHPKSTPSINLSFSFSFAKAFCLFSHSFGRHLLQSSGHGAGLLLRERSAVVS